MSIWIRCPTCDDFWCTLHDAHTSECSCPPIEEWTESPYAETVGNLSPGAPE